MNCPSCGVDIDKYQKTRERIRKENLLKEEFEALHGEHLKSYRKMAQLRIFCMWGISWGLISAVFFTLVFTLAVGGGESQNTGGLTSGVKIFIVLASVAMGAIFGYASESISRGRMNTKEERELWDNFCRQKQDLTLNEGRDEAEEGIKKGFIY